MRRALPWLLVLLAAGAGFLIGRETSDPAPPAATGAAHGSAPEGSVAATQPGRPDPGPRVRVESVAPGDTRRAVREFLARLPGPAPLALPTATAAITGVVRDKQGQPVAGVLIRAEPDLPRDLYPPDDDDEAAEVTSRPDEFVAESVAEYLDQLRRDVPLLREARTDAEGRFVLNRLLDFAYDVDAYAEGWVLDEVGDASEARPGDSVAFVATRLVPVEVDVVAADGSSVDHAWVYSQDEGDDPLRWDWISQRLEWSPSNRTILVPEGVRSFRARKGTVVSTMVNAEAKDGARVVLAIGAVGVLRVRIERPREGTARFEVVVRVTPEGDVPPREDDPPWQECDPDESSALFDAIPVGRWRVEAVIPARGTVAESTIDVVAGTREVSLRIPPLGPDDGFRVLLLDPDGKPIRNDDAELNVRRAAGEVHPLEAGAGEWFVLRDPETSAAGFQIEVYDGNGAGVTRTVPPRHTGDFVIRFPRLHRLEVVVPDGVEANEIHLVRHAPGGEEHGQEFDEHAVEDGVFLYRVPEGVYELRRESTDDSGAMRVHVAGDTRVRFAPSPFRALRVSGVESDGDAASWGLSDGDLVVGIDGEEFRDLLHIEALRATAALRGKAVLDVLRGRRRVRVEIDARRLRGWPGARLEPDIVE